MTSIKQHTLIDCFLNRKAFRAILHDDAGEVEFRPGIILGKNSVRGWDFQGNEVEVSLDDIRYLELITSKK